MNLDGIGLDESWLLFDKEGSDTPAHHVTRVRASRGDRAHMLEDGQARSIRDRGAAHLAWWCAETRRNAPQPRTALALAVAALELHLLEGVASPEDQHAAPGAREACEFRLAVVSRQHALARLQRLAYESVLLPLTERPSSNVEPSRLLVKVGAARRGCFECVGPLAPFFGALAALHAQPR